MLPGYRYINIANDLYEVWGDEVNWLHQSRGIFTFCNELFTPFNYFRSSQVGGGEVQYQFNKYLLLGDGFIPWHEVVHPQYGKIEVGGMHKNWGRQPPSFLLEEECHRNMAFSLFHADELPLVKIQSVEAKSLGGKLKQITAILENPKICPTHSVADVRRKITPPDVASIGGANVKVIAALEATEPFFREPTEQKRDPARVKLDTIPGHSVLYLRWLVEGELPFEVKIESVKGGRDARQVE
jgi:hypothetical protein